MGLELLLEHLFVFPPEELAGPHLDDAAHVGLELLPESLITWHRGPSAQVL
jgi:hypothetical protein